MQTKTTPLTTVFDFFDRFLVLSDEARTLVAETCVKTFFEKGTSPVFEGQKTTWMYILKTGIARGFSVSSGEDKTLNLWAEGQTFGDVTTYIAGLPAIKSYEILEDSHVYGVNIQAFRALFTKNLEIANLGRIMIEQYILEYERVRRLYLNKSAYERYCIFLTEKPGLLHRVKSKHIASYLDLSPETFSRINSLHNSRKP